MAPPARRARPRIRRASYGCCVALLVLANMLVAISLLAAGSSCTGGTLSAIRHAWHLDRAAADGAAQIPRPTSPEEQRRLTKAAVAAPVTVVSMTGHFFGPGFLKHYKNCTAIGAPDLEIQCHWTPHVEQTSGDEFDMANTADVIAYHAPSSCGQKAVKTRRPGQLTAMYSMESSAYFHCQKDPEWLRQFDITMTTNLNSTFTLPYIDMTVVTRWQDVSAIMPTAEKLDAVAFVNSNCGDPSGRTVKVQEIMDLGLVRVDAWGSCLRNQNITGRLPSKRKVFRKYKFCIAMENSVADDYVTEKIYHALMAGCLPIYLGTPNIAYFLPHPDSALVFQSAQQISDEMLRLMKDNTEYDRRVLSWRSKALSELPKGVQQLIAMRHPFGPECKVCRRVIQERVRQAAEP